MPNLRTFKIPEPTDWKEFEKIVQQSFQIRWDVTNLKLHGRQGQPQAGVDVYGDDNMFRQVGIQCKNYSGELKEDDINKEIEKAEHFDPKIESYYIATTAKPDAKIQAHVRKVSYERSRERKFPVDIFFWEDIISYLLKDPEIFNQFYPDYALTIKTEDFSNLNSQLYASLDGGYFGSRLSDWLELISFIETEDTRRDIYNLTQTLKQCTKALFIDDESERDEILLMIEEIFGEGNSSNSFKKNIEEVEAKYQTLKYRLKDYSLIVFKIGEILTDWKFYEDNNIDRKFSERTQEYLIEYIKRIDNKGIIVEPIKQYIRDYKELSDDFQKSRVPNKIHWEFKQFILTLA